MAVDVTDFKQVEGLIGLALERFGQLDVVVNNAGVMPLSPLERLRIDDWNRMIDINIRGVLHGIAAGLPVMRQQCHGQFVNLSSVGGHRVTPQAAVYSATKYAVMALSEGLRLEVGDTIRVTIISPGSTESELADSITDKAAKERMKNFRSVSIPASAVAASIAFAIEQPPEVDINEVIVRPTINNVLKCCSEHCDDSGLQTSKVQKKVQRVSTLSENLTPDLFPKVVYPWEGEPRRRNRRTNMTMKSCKS